MLNKNTLFIIFIGFFIIYGCSQKPEKKQSSNHQQEEDKTSKTLEDLYTLIPPVPAKVNGVEIKKDKVKIAINATVSRNMMMGENIKPESIPFIKEVLNDIISEELMFQESQSMNISVEDAKLNEEMNRLKKRFPSEEEFFASIKKQNYTLETIKEEVKKNLIIRQLIKKKSEEKEINFTENDAKKYYDENPQRFKSPPSAKVSQILVKFDREKPEDQKKAKEKINQLLEKALQGANFEKLAKENSDDPSAQRGGDMGYISKGRMIPIFEKMAFATEVGKISSVFETPFGYHVVKVFDKKEGTTIAFEEVKKNINEFLIRREKNNRINDWIEDLRKKAKIEVYI